MKYRRLGGAGVLVSELGLGTNRFGSETMAQAQVTAVVDTAEELGINFVDTSNSYNEGRSEQTLGVALRGRRDRFVLATKFWARVGSGPNDRGASRYHIVNAIEDSLQRLQTDRIDLYYLHHWAEVTPIEEIMRALDDLIRTGKVLYVGASRFAAWQLAYANILAELRGWTSFVALQSHYHLLERGVEREVLDCCSNLNVGLVPFFPLAGGFLTGKYVRGKEVPTDSRGAYSSYVQSYMTSRNYDILEAMAAWSQVRGWRANHLAIAWLLAKPQVCSVIAGVTKPEQLIENSLAINWQLTDEEMTEIETLLQKSN